jgi:hypothetical protein
MPTNNRERIGKIKVEGSLFRRGPGTGIRTRIGGKVTVSNAQVLPLLAFAVARIENSAISAVNDCLKCFQGGLHGTVPSPCFNLLNPFAHGAGKRHYISEGIGEDMLREFNFARGGFE